MAYPSPADEPPAGCAVAVLAAAAAAGCAAALVLAALLG